MGGGWREGCTQDRGGQPGSGTGSSGRLDGLVSRAYPFTQQVHDPADQHGCLACACPCSRRLGELWGGHAAFGLHLRGGYDSTLLVTACMYLFLQDQGQTCNNHQGQVLGCSGSSLLLLIQLEPRTS